MRSRSAAHALCQQPVFRGDASNQAPQLPGYAVVNMHASDQIDKTYQVYVRADNIFNNHYASYGHSSTPRLSPISPWRRGVYDPRSLSPARPLALYAAEGDVLEPRPGLNRPALVRRLSFTAG